MGTHTFRRHVSNPFVGTVVAGTRTEASGTGTETRGIRGWCPVKLTWAKRNSAEVQRLLPFSLPTVPAGRSSLNRSNAVVDVSLRYTAQQTTRTTSPAGSRPIFGTPPRDDANATLHLRPRVCASYGTLSPREANVNMHPASTTLLLEATKVAAPTVFAVG